MMLGESHRHHSPPSDPPSWPENTHPSYLAAAVSFPCSATITTARSKSLLNYEAILAALEAAAVNGDSSEEESDFPAADSDVYSSDEFRMYEFKVRRCTRGRAHDWTECPYEHPGEKARRRDPRRYNYCGTACTDFRKGNCKKGDTCEFAHGVFECWLHPSRYRTQPCKDGPHCNRRVCFFAHSPSQLRFVDSNRFEPVPGSPVQSDSNPVNELVSSLRNLQFQNGFGSPRGVIVRPGFFSLPSTPTRMGGKSGRVGYWDAWEKGIGEEPPPVMERVESGRELRVRMFEKLSKENPLNGSDPVEGSGLGPDVGWVSELIQ